MKVKRLTVQDYMKQGYNKTQAQRHVDWDTQREQKSVAAEIGVKISSGSASCRLGRSARAEECRRRERHVVTSKR